jgi:hypothetical protein
MAPRKKSAEDADAKAKKVTSERQRAHLVKARAAGRESGKLGGRPTSYKHEYAHVARLMCANGATDADLADAFHVTTMTIGRWQAKHPGFAVALKVAKGEYDDRVERALAQRAIGYSYDTEKVFMQPGSKEPVYVPHREHVPPDPYAAFRWLSCRRMHEWRDRKEVTGPAGEPLMPIIALLSEINGGTASLVEPKKPAALGVVMRERAAF